VRPAGEANRLAVLVRPVHDVVWIISKMKVA
jgi:hypothetical protein